jgi:predicted AlkP superfamily phosphohydrolase/phosphomutase
MVGGFELFLVLGIDAATWDVIRPNIDSLATFKKLCQVGQCRELVLKEKPISPSVWCGMFCGKTPDEHGHDSFVADGNIVRREDIKVDFIWDILHKQGKRVKVLNVPFIVPPYSFGVDFKPVGFGLPTNEREWQEELDRVTMKTRELMNEGSELIISVYTSLDRIQHFHWGEDCVLEWYKKLDDRIGGLLIDTGFLEEKKNKLIVISDHGFCSFGEAKIQTLPQKTEQGELKGDHHENALLITVNLDYHIERPQDVFFALKKEFETR